MTDFASVTDPSNPFNTSGLSLEVKALIQYVIDAKAATGHDFVVTSTTDHKRLSNSGKVSRHRQEGTEGEGLAIDGRMRTRGTSKGLHRPFFDAFVPVEHRLHELIYADPPSGKRADGTTGPYNIRNGKRVAPYAVSDHWDHGHVSVNKGVILKYPGASNRAVETPPATELRLINSYEVDMALNTYTLGFTTDDNGNGWDHVPFPRNRIVGHTAPGLRPGVDGRYLVGQVGFAEEGDKTVVSLTEWAPKAQAVIYLTVQT